MSLNNEHCKTRPFLIDLNHIDRKYLFTITLDKWNGSCNTFNNMSNKVCVPNKTENVDLNAFNLITRKNELEHISCKFESKKCNSNQIWNNDKCPCECKNPRQIVWKRLYLESY